MVRIGLAASLAALVTQSAAALVASLEFQSFNSPIDLDRNNGIPDVLSTALIVAAALGASALAATKLRGRWLPAALAVVLFIVALDDVLQAEVERGLRGMLVVATLATATLLIVALARHAPRRAALGLLIGLCLLVAAVKGAYAYDQFLNELGRGDQERGDLDYELGIVLKQGLELLGWSLVAIGVWAMAFAGRIESRSRSAGSGLRYGVEQ